MGAGDLRHSSSPPLQLLVRKAFLTHDLQGKVCSLPQEFRSNASYQVPHPEAIVASSSPFSEHCSYVPRVQSSKVLGWNAAPGIYKFPIPSSLQVLLALFKDDFKDETHDQSFQFGDLAIGGPVRPKVEDVLNLIDLAFCPSQADARAPPLCCRVAGREIFKKAGKKEEL